MSIETEQDLAGLTRIGAIVGQTLRAMAAGVRPGMTTAELDELGARLLGAAGARSAPALIYGFPGANCISLNHEVVHGIPGQRVIQPGDLVKIDVTAERDGYIADAALTVPVPPVSPLARALCDCAETALRQAIAAARAGRPVTEIGRVVERVARRRGFAIIPELTGHGVGRRIHEPPAVPNYPDPRLRDRLTDGLVITIEPILTAGSAKIVDEADGWTISTADRCLAAHVEHTIVVTRGQALVLTAA